MPFEKVGTWLGLVSTMMIKYQPMVCLKCHTHPIEIAWNQNTMPRNKFFVAY